MTDSPASPTRSARLRSMGVTLAVVIGALLLVTSGVHLIAASNATAPTVGEPPPAEVQAAVIEVNERYTITVDILGRVESAREALLGFETGGTLLEVAVEENATVRRGDVIARLDTERLDADRRTQQAARAALDARRELAELTTQRQQQLVDSRASSRQGFDEARLGLAEIEAELARVDSAIDAIDIAIERMTITAPFDGRIGARLLDEGTRVNGGQAVVRLFEQARPRFRAGLPPALARDLEPGTVVSLALDGEHYPATLRRVRNDINPQTRTRSAVFDVALPTDITLAEGAIGRLEVERTLTGRGAWVSLSALAEGVRGLWTLYLIDDEGIVRREAVEVVYADEQRAYVNGALDDGMRYVTTGTHRTTTGQRVIAQMMSSP